MHLYLYGEMTTKTKSLHLRDQTPTMSTKGYKNTECYENWTGCRYIRTWTTSRKALLTWGRCPEKYIIPSKHTHEHTHMCRLRVVRDWIFIYYASVHLKRLIHSKIQTLHTHTYTHYIKHTTSHTLGYICICSSSVNLDGIL